MQDEVDIKVDIKENIGWRNNVLMWSLWTLYICLAVAVAIARGDGPTGQGLASVRVEALLSKMTIEDKVGQMTQLDLSLFVSPETGQLDEQKLIDWVSKYRIGSLFNSPFAGHVGSWTATEWRQVIRRCQQIAAGAGSKLPLLIGLDSVHGANYVEGAVLFPQQIALAATFNPSVARKAGRVAARDTRAAGVPWLFAPILGIATQPLWPRTYETFGEDPFLASKMGAELVKGIQASLPGGEDDDDGEPLKAAACMKHFVGYSHPSSGHDRSPSRIPQQEVMDMYLRPFQAAVDAGVASAMESYNELNGVPMASSRRYLVDVLRGRMSFLGMLVTDYGEIVNLEGTHGVSGGAENSVALAMHDTSIDMSMVPTDASFTEKLLALVKAGKVSEKRINVSVRRVLSLKESLGLLDFPVPSNQSPLIAKVGSEEDKQAALQASREAITLLKNADMPKRNDEDTGGQALPLDRSKMSKILLVGPACHSLSLQSGGWTKHWQGAMNEGEFSSTEGRTILQGVQGLLNPSSLAAADGTGPPTGGEEADARRNQVADDAAGTIEVVFKKGISVDGSNESDRDQALSEAFSADAIVVCVGEYAFAEKMGDVEDLALPSSISAFVKELRKVTDAATPVVLALVEGRPRLLGDLTRVADAVLHTYLLGPSGGQAVAEVLFGDVNPSGRLPITYPRQPGNIPLPYHRPISERCQKGDDYMGTCDVEWWFGEGLSYTEFGYSKLEVQPSVIQAGQSFTVSLLVENKGDVAGDDAVLLFATDVVRRVTPRYKLLKGFDKVRLEPGEVQKVTFELTSEDLEYVDLTLRSVLEEGIFLFAAGPETDCRKFPAQCASLTVSHSDSYHPSCEAACGLWYPPDDAAPGGYVCPSEAKGVFRNKKACVDECIEASWGWDYVSCLEQAVWTGSCAFNQRCRAVGSAAIAPPDTPGSLPGSPPLNDIGSSSVRPRTGSVDLAVGVGVGMCIGGAAVFVVLATMRKRRLQRLGGRQGVGGNGVDPDDAVLWNRTGARGEGGVGGRGVGGKGSWRGGARRRGSGGFISRRGKASSSVAVRQVLVGPGGFDSEEEALTGELVSTEEARPRVEGEDETGVELQQQPQIRGGHRGVTGTGWGSMPANKVLGADDEAAEVGGESWMSGRRGVLRKSGSDEALLSGRDRGYDEL